MQGLSTPMPPSQPSTGCRSATHRDIVCGEKCAGDNRKHVQSSRSIDFVPPSKHGMCRRRRRVWCMRVFKRVVLLTVDSLFRSAASFALARPSLTDEQTSGQLAGARQFRQYVRGTNLSCAYVTLRYVTLRYVTLRYGPAVRRVARPLPTPIASPTNPRFVCGHQPRGPYAREPQDYDQAVIAARLQRAWPCLLYTSPSPRDS